MYFKAEYVHEKKKSIFPLFVHFPSQTSSWYRRGCVYVGLQKSMGCVSVWLPDAEPRPCTDINGKTRWQQRGLSRPCLHARWCFPRALRKALVPPPLPLASPESCCDCRPAAPFLPLLQPSPGTSGAPSAPWAGGSAAGDGPVSSAP